MVQLIVLTTNIISPIIFIPRLLPKALNRLILKIFKVSEEDVFPTYHRFNSPEVLKKGVLQSRARQY